MKKPRSSTRKTKLSPDQATIAAGAKVLSSKPVGIKVALVEDDAEARGLLSEWVSETAGFACVGSCGSAEDALLSFQGAVAIGPAVKHQRYSATGHSCPSCDIQCRSFTFDHAGPPCFPKSIANSCEVFGVRRYPTSCFRAQKPASMATKTRSRL